LANQSVLTNGVALAELDFKASLWLTRDRLSASSKTIKLAYPRCTRTSQIELDQCQFSPQETEVKAGLH